MFKIYFVGFILIVLIFFGFQFRSMTLNEKLEQAQADLQSQLSENAKLISVYESKLVQNINTSDAIISELKSQIEIESKRAQVEKETAERALKDHASITDKYNKTAQKLGLILNEKNNSCVDDDLPVDVLQWVRSLTL